MKFYLAGKWTEKQQMLEHVNSIEKLHTCTHKWMLHEGETKSDCAFNDIQGVIEADFIVIMITDPKYPYRGTFSELGAALASNHILKRQKPIFIIDPFTDSYASTNCFYHHPDVKHLTDIKQLMSVIM